MTMRELLDILKTATPEELAEFSAWWAELPITSNVYYPPACTIESLRDLNKTVMASGPSRGGS
jgi:hypothetical protein